MTTTSSSDEIHATRTPLGSPVSFYVRPGTSDRMVVESCLGNDEYRLRDVALGDGVALDVGAHIGAVAVALAADHPEATVIAIEPVPENAELVRRNAALNGVTVRVIEAAAGSGTGSAVCRHSYRSVEGHDADYVETNRYIGNVFRGLATESVATEVMTVGLADVLDGRECAFLKTDCEGAEWDFLDSPAVAQVALIRGEFHDEPQPAERLHALLGATHDVTCEDKPVCGLFEAVRRG